MNKKIKIALIFGTRPEAIKMCPLVKKLKENNSFEVYTILTAQHRQMLDSVVKLFGVVPDFDLNLMKPNQNLWTRVTYPWDGCLDKLFVREFLRACDNNKTVDGCNGREPYDTLLV